VLQICNEGANYIRILHPYLNRVDINGNLLYDHFVNIILHCVRPSVFPFILLSFLVYVRNDFRSVSPLSLRSRPFIMSVPPSIHPSVFPSFRPDLALFLGILFVVLSCLCNAQLVRLSSYVRAGKYLCDAHLVQNSQKHGDTFSPFL
jgi:hypothetical protein